MSNYTFKIYKKMFPGNNYVLPSIDELDIDGDTISYEYEDILSAFVSEYSLDVDEIEINEFLKLFKKNYYTQANGFISDAIDFYFSHPQVISVLQQGRVTLFPNYRALPEIDYDLLIPVMELYSGDE
ncbi:hypothetical protein ACFOSD_08005 [Salinispirillum marinum]|uniref:Uncharacterized protein n=2 Tax=Saccharospirillaceae TaxID=255527 RepID=A0ABV8BH23_9GAMM